VLVNYPHKLNDSEIKDYSDFILAHGKGLGPFEGFLERCDCRLFLSRDEIEIFMSFIDDLEGKEDTDRPTELLTKYKYLFPNDG
jgi:hypothetical protein